MDALRFSNLGCEQVGRQLDSYVDSELLAETTLELLRHLESCAACSRKLELRVVGRSALRHAVKSSPTPPDLAIKVRHAIHSSRRTSARGYCRRFWSLILRRFRCSAFTGSS